MHAPPNAPDPRADPATGLSVIIPSHRPVSVVSETLASLAAQTLDPRAFEVIVVVNGKPADAKSDFLGVRERFPNLGLRVHWTHRPGTSHALNLGIQSARGAWVTFVDDDDTVTPGYLAGLVGVARPGVIPITAVDDIASDGSRSSETLLNHQLRSPTEQVVAPELLLRGLGLNVAKLVPTAWARAVRHSVALRSGHDVAFWAELYARFDFQFAIVPPDRDSAYLRHLTASSLSRQESNWRFAVIERIDVIAALDRLLHLAPAGKAAGIRSLASSQARFINRHLAAHPEDAPTAREEVRRRGISRFPWTTFNESFARTLVVSVCFPPFSDASAVTAAKRVRERGAVVDVVTNDMSAVRPHDPSLDAIAGEFVSREVRVSAPPSFAAYGPARDFALSAWDRIRPDDGAWPYDMLYSRAMWPASHVAAAWIKSQRPETHWIAEFSDPLSLTVTGEPRPGSLELDEFADSLLTAAEAGSGLTLPVPSTVFELAELVPYALADELWFTNQHQLDYMIEHIPNEALATRVRARAAIHPHPAPDAALYNVVEASMPFDRGRTRLAYFGSFYPNRSLTEVMAALRNLPGQFRRRLRVDVYADANELRDHILELELDDVVHVGTRVDYLQFLNLTTKYDCLVVNDAETVGTHGVNPYLPSKWSDYRGSGTPVWAIVEPGSTLSTADTAYRSSLGDVQAAAAILRSLAERADHLRRRSNDVTINALQVGEIHG